MTAGSAPAVRMTLPSRPSGNARKKSFTVKLPNTADTTKHVILFDGELIKSLSQG
jgi:hypothetical protein